MHFNFNSLPSTFFCPKKFWQKNLSNSFIFPENRKTGFPEFFSSRLAALGGHFGGRIFSGIGLSSLWGQVYCEITIVNLSSVCPLGSGVMGFNFWWLLLFFVILKFKMSGRDSSLVKFSLPNQCFEAFFIWIRWQSCWLAWSLKARSNFLAFRGNRPRLCLKFSRNHTGLCSVRLILFSADWNRLSSGTSAVI